MTSLDRSKKSIFSSLTHVQSISLKWGMGQKIFPVFSAQTSLSLFTTTLQPHQKTKVQTSKHEYRTWLKLLQRLLSSWVGRMKVYWHLQCKVLTQQLLSCEQWPLLWLSRWWLGLLVAFVKRDLTSLMLLQSASQNSPTLLKINESVDCCKTPESGQEPLSRVN